MRRFAFLTAVTVVVAATSSAESILRQWTVSRAEADAFATGGGGHVVWFQNAAVPGAGNQYVFDGAPGVLNEVDVDDDGLADELRLTGRVISKVDSSFAFDLDLTFLTRGPGAMSPKKELKPAAYSENGGPVDTSTWTYWEPRSPDSELVGSGPATAGLVLPITPYPADGETPFQLGVGANGKNVNMGLAGWFTYVVDDQAYRGDINVDLELVPEPTSLALLLAGAGTLLTRRFRG